MDGVVWEYARLNGLVIVSKDADFYEHSIQAGAPPQAIPIPEELAPLYLTGIVAGSVARRAILLAVGLVAGVLVIRWARH